MAKPTHKEKLLNEKIDRLLRLNRELFAESSERGKALEKLRGLIIGYEDLMPEEVHSNFMEIIAPYDTRCTCKTPFERRRDG